MYTCFLMGAHDAPAAVQEKLNDVVKYLVEQRAVTEFIVGNRGNFDAMATAAVQQVLRQHPEKELVALRLEPYPFDQRHRTLPAFFDGFFTPEGLETVPKRLCIEAANRKTLESSDFFVTWIYLTGSNSGKMLERAQNLEKQGLLEVYDLR